MNQTILSGASPVGRQKPPTVLVVLSLVLIGFVVLMDLAVVGLILWAIWHPPSGNQAMKTSSPASTPAPSEENIKFPNLSPEKYPYRYFSGVKVSTLVDPLVSRGFRCHQPEDASGLGLATIECGGKDPASGVFYSVGIQTRSETQVNTVDVLAYELKGRPDLSKTLPFFDLVAAYPFPQNSNLAKQATSWTNQNMTTQQTTQIGNLSYGTVPQPGSYFLTINAGMKVVSAAGG